MSDKQERDNWQSDALCAMQSAYRIGYADGYMDRTQGRGFRQMDRSVAFADRRRRWNRSSQMEQSSNKTNWTIERIPEGKGTGWYVYCLLYINADTYVEGEGEAETVEGALADCLTSLVANADKKRRGSAPVGSEGAGR